MKANKFEDIISTSINKLKSSLSAADITTFQQQLNALPKKIKQFNAQPYLFIFDMLLKRREFVQYVLTSFVTMLQENYITYLLYDKLAVSLSPLLVDFSYGVLQVLLKVKQPHLGLFKIFFDIHSTISLPEDSLKKLKNLGYVWLIRLFSFTDRPLSTFAVSIYAKFYPQEMPKLQKIQQEDQQMKKYVGLVVNQIVAEVQNMVQGEKVKRGKYNFCFICKNTADYYCKDTKAPVCGVQCKKTHLDLLSKTNSLNFQYSLQFCQQIQAMLINNLTIKRSPALSIDFLIAIYLYSSYIPNKQFHNLKTLSLPVIFERIWLLYYSYFAKKGQHCDHIIASCLSLQNNQFIKQMATDYFLMVANQNRLIQVYSDFDRDGQIRLITTILTKLQQNKKLEFIQILVQNVYNHYSRNSQIFEDRQRSIARTLNHQKQITPHLLSELFGDNYEQKLIKFIMRNQLQLNRQKMGEYLFSNQELCRKFLKILTQRKGDAPIDELIRQIFYFINVKISDKIYRLFELLAQIYEPKEPFNELNFFTYAYFIIMIVTEINNPSVMQKPTLSEVMSRVQKFSPELVKDYPYIIEGMFERASAFPFAQTSRGILSVYQPIKNNEKRVPLQPQQIIISNWQLIYQVLLVSKPQVQLLFRLCGLVVNYPAICQTFLQLLVDRLGVEPRDTFLVQAISNIIEQQPNAAGFLWKPILNQSKKRMLISSETYLDQTQIFSLSLIVNSTRLLKDDNFYQFTRQFSSQFPMIDNLQYYMQLINLNRDRMSLVTQSLISNFQKSNNYYLQIQFVKQLGQYLEQNQEQNCCIMLLQMIKIIHLSSVTQGLFLQLVTSINFDRFLKASQFWNVISHKCLEIKQDKKVVILQSYMKNSKCCESYQSYLIQKTLNCHKQELISEEILKNLSKLQPYLNQINPELLKLFLLQQNIETILTHFKFFSGINKTYDLILHKLESDVGWIGHQRLVKLTNNIKQMLLNPKIEKSIFLSLNTLPVFIVRVMQNYNPEMLMPLLDVYVQLLTIDCQTTEYSTDILKDNLMIVTNINIVSEALGDFIDRVSQKCYESVESLQEFKSQFDQMIAKLISVVDILHKQARLFQINVQLRLGLKKLLKSQNLPSLLKSSTRLCKISYTLQNILHHPSEPSLMKLLHQVDTVIQRQSNISIQQKEAPAKHDNGKIILIESNKDSLQYGELLIDIAYKYLREKQQLEHADKGILKRILISILLQGFFNDKTCAYESLAGSAFATKITEIFHMLK